MFNDGGNLSELNETRLKTVSTALKLMMLKVATLSRQDTITFFRLKKHLFNSRFRGDEGR